MEFILPITHHSSLKIELKIRINFVFLFRSTYLFKMKHSIFLKGKNHNGLLFKWYNNKILKIIISWWVTTLKMAKKILTDWVFCFIELHFISFHLKRHARLYSHFNCGVYVTCVTWHKSHCQLYVYVSIHGIWLFLFLLLFCYRSFEKKIAVLKLETPNSTMKCGCNFCSKCFDKNGIALHHNLMHATIKHYILINRLYCMSFSFIDWCEVLLQSICSSYWVQCVLSP